MHAPLSVHSRHARACPGHPRLLTNHIKTWMSGINPAVTGIFCRVLADHKFTTQFPRSGSMMHREIASEPLFFRNRCVPPVLKSCMTQETQ
jgi:hypothetical protein